VTADARGPQWNEFQQQVVSAVSEAFNNLVLHGYRGKANGRVDMAIRAGGGSIKIELRDWGKSFDPQAIPEPQFDTLPESGMGIFIMRSFMGVAYRKGRPNLLTLSKKLEASAPVTG
jgi:serine/threonine-protein kinase RsbW